LKQVATHLRKFGVEIIDLCVSGWVINPSNVAEIKQKLEQIGVGSGTAVVTDLFGNSVFRFEDFDGSISKPIKVGGGIPPGREGQPVQCRHL